MGQEVEEENYVFYQTHFRPHIQAWNRTGLVGLKERQLLIAFFVFVIYSSIFALSEAGLVTIPARTCKNSLTGMDVTRAVLRLRGGRKGVSAKHTSTELARKEAEATKNKGGGKAGMIDRLGGEAGHAKFVCPVCKIHNVSIKNMQDHHENKHPGVPFDAEACVNTHEIFGGSTKGIAVHGTLKKAKAKAKEKKKEDE